MTIEQLETLLKYPINYEYVVTLDNLGKLMSEIKEIKEEKEELKKQINTIYKTYEDRIDKAYIKIQRILDYLAHYKQLPKDFDIDLTSVLNDLKGDE